MDYLLSVIQDLQQHLPSQDVIADHIQHITPLGAVIGGLIVWVGVVRTLRWRRFNAIHGKYGTKWQNGLGTLMPQEAQEITHLSSKYDMPFLIHRAVSFALFKTYGIPTISKLLAATKELKSKETVSRRYADTEILISTWAECPISGFSDASYALTNKHPDAKPADDPRANIALARVNWLHSKYQISNDDFLYTLCLFVVEPIYWSDRHGWRRLSPLERHAYYVLWSEVGRKMNITNIPASLEDMMAWSKNYEHIHMAAAKSNHDVADYTVDELLSSAPEALGIKSFGKKLVICLLDDLTREAMMYKKASSLLRLAVNGLLSITGIVQRFLLLPRASGLWTVETGPPATTDKFPRLHPTRFATHPWYRPEATSILGHVRDRFLVAINWHTEMPSAQLKSAGYRIEEMGPIKFEHAGHEEVMEMAAKLQGCPITGPWSLEGRESM